MTVANVEGSIARDSGRPLIVAATAESHTTADAMPIAMHQRATDGRRRRNASPGPAGASLPRQADSMHASTNSPNSHRVAAKCTARADASRTFIAVDATRARARAQRATSKL
jgi:hypothetical protein